MRTQADAARRAGRSALVAAALLATAALLGGCGDDEPAAGPETAGGEPCGVVEEGTVRIVAQDVAWDRDCLEAPEGAPFTVVVDNRDDGVNHDFRLTIGDDVHETPLEAGPVVQRLEVPPLDAGRYGYVCEIHPNMAGTLEVVAPASGPPAG